MDEIASVIPHLYLADFDKLAFKFSRYQNIYLKTLSWQEDEYFTINVNLKEHKYSKTKAKNIFH